MSIGTRHGKGGLLGSRSRCRGHGLARAALAGLLGIAALLGPAGCFETKTTRCSWGRVCPEGLVCDEAFRTCIHPSQAALCRDLPDGEPCQPDELSSGLYLCLQGVCRRSRCGDGVRDPRPEAGEACDDGNTVGGDGCRADCRGLEQCGDGLWDPDAGEVCDDGNLDDNDQCTRLCDYPRCGDGLLSGREECDDGDEGNSDALPDACRTGCVLPACDDQVVDSADRLACWRQAEPLATTDAPSEVHVGDLDGDGLDDLAVFSPSQRRLDLYLSVGDGTFMKAPGSPLALGSTANDVSLGDLTGDGAAEIVLGRENDTAVQIFLNDGDGRFTPLPPVGPLVSSANSLLVTDFDGDGVPDVAAAHPGSCSLLLLRGDGTGSLDNATVSDLLAGSCSVDGMAAADFDGDGAMDFVVATYDDGVFVAARDGLGGAAIPPGLSRWSTGIIVRGIAVGDFDGDGLPDIVYPEQRPPQTPLRVLRNLGGFVFEEPPWSPVLLGVASMRVAAGDLDGDGRVDFALCDYFASATFLLYGTPDGTFDVHTPAGGLARPYDDVAVGRFTFAPFQGVALINTGEDRLTVFWPSP